MSASLAHIYRHPIKAHGREPLASVVLSAGAALPWDRAWAVTHSLSKFDPARPEWTPCGQFQRGARTPALMAITSAWDEASGILRLSHPLRPDLRFDPETEGAAFLDWIVPLVEDARFQPKDLVRVPGVAMTDSDYPSVSINSMASNAALGQHMGMALDPARWRGNLLLEGLEPWAENDWVGRRLRIGASLLEIRERIGRCKATTVNPATGLVDADTLSTLRRLTGAQEFGVFAVVLEGGRIAPGDEVELIG